MKLEKSHRRRGNITPRYKNITLTKILVKISNKIYLKKENGKDLILKMIYFKNNLQGQKQFH